MGPVTCPNHVLQGNDFAEKTFYNQLQDAGWVTACPGCSDVGCWMPGGRGRGQIAGRCVAVCCCVAVVLLFAVVDVHPLYVLGLLKP